MPPFSVSRRARLVSGLAATALVLGTFAAGLNLVGTATPAAAHGAGTQLDDAGLEALIWCESRSHGRYATQWSSRAPFRGAVQWVQTTWDTAAPAAGFPEWSGQPANVVPPAVQDAVTMYWWASSNPDSQWPVCHAKALERIGTGDPGPYQVCGTDEWSTGPWSRKNRGACPTFGAPQASLPLEAVSGPLAVSYGTVRSASASIEVGDGTVLACDIDGDGRTETVVVRDGQWSVPLGGHPDITYGRDTDTPLCGDIDGNGTDDPIAVRDGRWLIRLQWSNGVAERSVAFGRSTDTPLVCDTDGDGIDEQVVVRGAIWFVDLDHNGGDGEHRLSYGRSGDTPVCGDLDGDNIDDLTVVRAQGDWYAKRTWSSGTADDTFSFGTYGSAFLIG